MPPMSAASALIWRIRKRSCWKMNFLISPSPRRLIISTASLQFSLSWRIFNSNEKGIIMLKNRNLRERTFLFAIFLSVFFCSFLFAEPNKPSQSASDASAANRPKRQPRNQWAEYSKQSDDWYRSSEGIRIANNILSWQSRQGSWPKNTNTTLEPFTGNPKTLQGTFDNSATTNEIRFLA